MRGDRGWRECEDREDRGWRECERRQGGQGMGRTGGQGMRV